MSGFFLDPRRLLSWILSHGLSVLDFGLVLLLTYMLLLIIGERRTFWMVRGLIYLMLASVISDALGLRLLGLVLEKLILGAAGSRSDRCDFSVGISPFFRIIGQRSSMGII